MNYISKKTSKKGLLLIVLLLVASMLMVACDKKTNPSDLEVVAKVNDLEITKNEYFDYLVEQTGTEVLDAFIHEKILELEMETNDINITDSEIDQERAAMVKNSGGEEEFNKAMEHYKFTEESFRKNIKLNLGIEKLLGPVIEVTEEEVLTKFNQDISTFETPDKVNANHILVEDEETALEVVKKLENGEEFSKLAEEYSQDLSNASNGGALGFFEKGKMVPEFEEEAFKMEVNEISDPVKTPFGYHIIQLVAIEKGSVAVLEDVYEQIETYLKTEKINSEYPQWYAGVQEKYKIKILLND